jgi:hypothetical protein
VDTLESIIELLDVPFDSEKLTTVLTSGYDGTYDTSACISRVEDRQHVLPRTRTLQSVMD